MNWTRGFFRLWAVVSSCWVIGTTIGYWDDLVGQSCCSDGWSGRMEAIGMILLPPASLMLFGFALVWIAKGFCSDRKS